MNDKELNIALGKLFNGIELDTHKVELASNGDKILKELNAIFDDLGKEESKIDKPYNALRNILIDWFQLLDTSESDVDEQEDKLKKFISDVQDLGLQKNDVKIISQIEQKIKVIRFYIKKSKSVNWKID